MSEAEFSRPERVDGIGEGVRQVRIAATPAEAAALARRFGLVAVERLEAAFALHRDAVGIVASGRVTADVVQSCVATGTPVAAGVDEPVVLRFVAAGETGGDDIELDADALDTITHDGTAIDLGETAAETMALALDPFPRSPAAAEALAAAGVIGEEQAGPFGALAGLRERLAGDQS